MLAKHSLGIDASFATMSDQPTHNLGYFVQAAADSHVIKTTTKRFKKKTDY